jgi:zona occludens toxin (predicted ATPase)
MFIWQTFFMSVSLWKDKKIEMLFKLQNLLYSFIKWVMCELHMDELMDHLKGGWLILP